MSRVEHIDQNVGANSLVPSRILCGCVLRTKLPIGNVNLRTIYEEEGFDYPMTISAKSPFTIKDNGRISEILECDL